MCQSKSYSYIIPTNPTAATRTCVKVRAQNLQRLHSAKPLENKDNFLAVKRSGGVAPEVNLGECILHLPPKKVNKAEPNLALKPRGDITKI